MFSPFGRAGALLPAGTVLTRTGYVCCAAAHVLLLLGPWPATTSLSRDVHNTDVYVQGRMFIFTHYVCFHSNVFGYVKKKVIPGQVREGGVWEGQVREG